MGQTQNLADSNQGGSRFPRTSAALSLVTTAAILGVLCLGALGIGVATAFSTAGQREEMAAQLEALRGDIQSSRSESVAALEEAAVARADLSAVTIRIADARRLLADIDKSRDKALTDQVEAESKATVAREASKGLDERLEQLKSVTERLDRAEARRAVVSKEVSDQELELASNFQRLTDAGKRIAGAEATIMKAAELDATIAANQTQVRKLAAELSSSKSELVAVQTKLEDARNALVAVDVNAQKLADIEQEIQAKSRKAGEISAQLAALEIDTKSVGNLRSERSRLQVEVDSLKAVKQQAEQANAALTASAKLTTQLEEAFTRIARGMDGLSKRLDAVGGTVEPPASGAPKSGKGVKQ